MAELVRHIRALWLVRPNLTSSPGGDTTQVLETAASLRAQGVTVELSSVSNPDLSGFDIVHLFHLDRVWENVHWCRLVRAAGIPAALSPIHWPTEKFDRRGRRGLARMVERVGGTGSYNRLKLWYHAAAQALKRGDRRSTHAALDFQAGRRFVLGTASVLLPNSEAEREQLAAGFPGDHGVFVVPNAVNPNHFTDRGGDPRPNGDGRDRAVLCVGRIEPRKNQLAIIRALRGSGLRLRIVGRAGDFNRRYERQCRREAGSNVEFLGWKEPAELVELYRASAAHVSASWYETPGLASLEAASCGRPIVVTPGGATREYFGGDAEYCAPDDVVSIRRAVERALARPASNGLANRIATEFTWEVAAQETIKAYEWAVASGTLGIAESRRHAGQRSD